MTLVLPWWLRWKWICLQCKRDLGSIPGLGRSPEEGYDNPLQYSCLENPIDSEAWQAIVHGVTRVRHTWVTNTHTHTHTHPYMEEYGFSCWTPAQLSDMKGITECFQWKSLHLSKYKCRMKKTSKGHGDSTKWKMLMKENGPVGQILFLKMKTAVCKVVSKMLQLYIHWDFAFWEPAFGFTNEFISFG